MNYVLHLIILLEIFIILSLSLNLVVGLNGFLSLAQAAFYGIGAYTTALLMVAGHNFFISVLLAVIIATMLSLLISIASLRFSGDIFILVTLAFQEVFFSIIYNWKSVTRGPFGIPGIPRVSLIGSSLAGLAFFYGILTCLVVFVMRIILRSQFALSVTAVREDVLAARGLGKNVFTLRTRSVAIAAAIAAIAGGMYASYLGFIDPTSFTVDESILLVAVVIVGGTGNLLGPIVGSAVIILLPELLRFLQIPETVAPNIRLILYGFCLVVFMYLRPRGIAGVYRLE
ncbi:MAG: branched-chain amino acid ABC transporter permease [Planctomycetes bacterium]|nr:branched-chain amino acid ABC transporter permease [Planctomycetota bacterium]